MRGTEARRWGVPDRYVVVVSEGEHDLLVNCLGWHIGRGRKACSAWYLLGFVVLYRIRSLSLEKSIGMIYFEFVLYGSGS